MSWILDKVVVVDELSLRKEEEVWVKVKSLDSSKLRAAVHVFFNDQGYDLKISPEPPNHVGCPWYSDDGNNGGGLGGNDDDRSRHHRRSHRSGNDDDDDLSDRSHSPSHDAPEPSLGWASRSLSMRLLPSAQLVGHPPPVLPSGPLVPVGSRPWEGPPSPCPRRA